MSLKDYVHVITKFLVSNDKNISKFGRTRVRNVS